MTSASGLTSSSGAPETASAIVLAVRRFTRAVIDREHRHWGRTGAIGRAGENPGPIGDDIGARNIGVCDGVEVAVVPATAKRPSEQAGRRSSRLRTDVHH